MSFLVLFLAICYTGSVIQHCDREILEADTVFAEYLPSALTDHQKTSSIIVVMLKCQIEVIGIGQFFFLILQVGVTIQRTMVAFKGG